jgi:hypothetical protein
MDWRTSLVCLALSISWVTRAAAQSADGNSAPEPLQGQLAGGPLPAWLKLGAELRGRAEANRDVNFQRGVHDRGYLNRIRLDVGIEPRSWLRFHWQGQDARGLAFRDRPTAEALTNSLDTRLAYAEVGNLEQGAWGLRAGRQELAFGDERLVGADSYWDAFGLSFDAVRLSVGKGRVRMDGFAALPVEPLHGALDRIAAGEQVYGLYTRITHRGSAVLEPYFLWRHSREALDEWDNFGTRDVHTYGVRGAGDLPRNFDYNLETAFQRGHVVNDRIGAWAGHWELGYKFGSDDLAPRLALEYNHASGDSNPGDSRQQTFNDFFPSGYTQYGLKTPYRWRNLHHLASAVTWKFRPRWVLRGGFRALWLASMADGLYADGGDYLVRNPEATSAHIGNQLCLLAGYESSSVWRLHLGYARLFPGAYLRESTYDGALSSSLNLTWSVRF